MEVEDTKAEGVRYMANINANSDNIRVARRIGTWYVIDSREYNGEVLYLLEHEVYGDSAACVIVNAEGELIQDEIHNGFSDYDEILGRT